jgi:hypothetical protein
LIGGAGGLEEETESRLDELFREHLVPMLVSAGASVVDGGTNSGVMRAIGLARSEAGAEFQLVGVAAAGTVSSPGDVPEDDADAEVDKNHSHLVLVPGQRWGDESIWLAEVASVLAGEGHPSATLLVNGGEIAYEDVLHSLTAGRPVIVLAGSGRTAEAISTAAVDSSVDERARRIAASPLVRIVPIDNPGTATATIRELLTVRTGE